MSFSYQWLVSKKITDKTDFYDVSDVIQWVFEHNIAHKRGIFWTLTIVFLPLPVSLVKMALNVKVRRKTVATECNNQHVLKFFFLKIKLKMKCLLHNILDSYSRKLLKQFLLLFRQSQTTHLSQLIYNVNNVAFFHCKLVCAVSHLFELLLLNILETELLFFVEVGVHLAMVGRQVEPFLPNSEPSQIENILVE